MLSSQSRLELLICHDDEETWQDGKVDSNIEDGKEMLDKLESSKNEIEKEKCEGIDKCLDNPGPKCHVDVHYVALFSIPHNILSYNKKKLKLPVHNHIKWNY